MSEPTGSSGEIERVGGGCGVSGCLYGAVALFALLLIGMLIVAVVRFSNPPEPRLGPQPAHPVGMSAPAPAGAPATVGTERGGRG